MSGLQNNVLVVDDELLIALSLSLQIEGMGMAVYGDTFTNGRGSNCFGPAASTVNRADGCSVAGNRGWS